MITEIYVCLDLGNDTLKISFAYKGAGKDARSKEVYGKLNVPDLLNQVAYPAAAFYDIEAKKWLFAEELETGENSNFSTVVKIKEMLSLIVNHEDAEIEKRNRQYYTEGHFFPKFSFPVRRKIGRDFQYLVNNNLVFRAPSYTPQKMCEEFFMHMKKQITKRIDDYSRATGVQFRPLSKIALVHPSNLGDEYIEELYRLIKLAFGVAPIKDLTSTRALGSFALYSKLLTREDERMLIFDMGDETLSVAKVWCNEVSSRSSSKKKMGILVDSPSAHLSALNLGGSNIDEEINGYLENSIHNRETVGSPSSDHPDHIFEEGLCSNQYLLMKDIKKAKMLMQMVGKGIFRDGVPLSIRRETIVQRMLSASDFSGCVGIGHKDGIAAKTLSYILEELALPVNRDVTKIMFAGGMAETAGLVSFIRNALAENYGHIPVLSFENPVNDNDPFRIQFFETSTYAGAVGGAIAALLDYSVEAALSYSYGTWFYPKESVSGQIRKHLGLFAERGSALTEDQNEFCTPAPILLSSTEIDELEGDEMFSTIINSKEIDAHRYAGTLTYDGEYLIIGEENEECRRRAEQVIDLRVISSKATKIRFLYRGRRIAISGDTGQELFFEEGFVVDKKGIAKPFFRNCKSRNISTVTARYLDTKQKIYIQGKDIEFQMQMDLDQIPISE